MFTPTPEAEKRARRGSDLRTTFLPVLLCTWWGLVNPCVAQDIDGNGLTDAVESQLALRFAPSIVMHADRIDEPEPVEILGGPDGLSAADLWVEHWIQLTDFRNVFIEDISYNSSPLAGQPYYFHYDGQAMELQPDHLYLPHFDYGGPGNEYREGWLNTYENHPQYKGALYPPTVYARFLNPYYGDPGTWAIEYWMFYPFNQWKNDHEGDWEHIQVVLDQVSSPSQSSIVQVRYFFHSNYLDVNNSNQGLPFIHVLDETHPVVFVGGQSIGEPCGNPGSGDYSGGSYPAGGIWGHVANIPVCNDDPDDEVTPGRFIPYDELEIQVMPNVFSPLLTDSYWTSHPNQQWMKTHLRFGQIEVPAEGEWIEGLFTDDIGNNAPPGPFYNTNFGEYHTPWDATPLAVLPRTAYVMLQAGSIILRPFIEIQNILGNYESKRAPTYSHFNTEVRLPRFVEQDGVFYQFVSWDDGNQAPTRAFSLSATTLLRALYEPAVTEVTPTVLPDAVTLTNATAAAWGDFDNDKRLDLVVAGGLSPTRVHLYRNTGSNALVEVASAALNSPINLVAGLSCIDFDNDGWLDISASTGIEDKLFRNLGASSFVDVAAGQPIADQNIGAGVAWADYDRDGWVDLYLANFGQNSLIRNSGPDPQYGNLPADWNTPENWNWSSHLQGTFGVPNDVSVSRAVAWADYNKDSQIDFALANRGQAGSCNDVMSPNRLARNTRTSGSEPSFTTVNQACGSSQPLPFAWAHAQSVAWGDFNHDYPNLYLDVLLASEQGVQLFESLNGQLPLIPEENTEFIADSLVSKLRPDVGLPTTGNFKSAAWLDFDNDGDQDLCLGRSDATLLYENHSANPDNPMSSSRYFSGYVIAPASTGALAWGDYDSDGDLDLLLGGTNGCRLYRNERRAEAAGLTTSNYLHLDLVGTRSNRSAIGARVRLEELGVDFPARRQFRQVEGGSGYSSFNSLTVEFGLKAATSVATLDIAWPSGRVETLTGITANQHLVLYEPVDVTANAVMNPGFDPGNRGVVCPQGDGAALVVTLQFDEPPLRQVTAGEITLGKPRGEGVLFFPEDGSCWPNPHPFADIADGPVSLVSPYTTTLTKTRMGGCGMVFIPIYWNGVQIDSVVAEFRSPDFVASSPGAVDAGDLSRFANSLGFSEGHPRHDPCAALTYNGAVDGGALSAFAAHLEHACWRVQSKASRSRARRNEWTQRPEGPVQKLGQNMPNPFNPTTRIGYSLSIASTAQLMITDVRGRVVRTLVQTHQEAGDYVAIWDGRDDHGHRVASGVYFYHLKAAGRVESRRMVVAR